MAEEAHMRKFLHRIFIFEGDTVLESVGFHLTHWSAHWSAAGLCTKGVMWRIK